MSPRRKVDSAERFVTGEYFTKVPVPQPRRGLPVIAGVATLLLVAALAASTFLLVSHEREAASQARSASVLGYVEEFMKGFTAIDPFHANDYVDRIQRQATGEFGKQFKERKDEAILRVARLQPSRGVIEAAGVQRWNDDGSADVLIAMKVTKTSADGKATIESGYRWVITASEEGRQWKISRMNEVL